LTKSLDAIMNGASTKLAIDAAVQACASEVVSCLDPCRRAVIAAKNAAIIIALSVPGQCSVAAVRDTGESVFVAAVLAMKAVQGDDGNWSTKNEQHRASLCLEECRPLSSAGTLHPKFTPAMHAATYAGALSLMYPFAQLDTLGNVTFKQEEGTCLSENNNVQSSWPERRASSTALAHALGMSRTSDLPLMMLAQKEGKTEEALCAAVDYGFRQLEQHTTQETQCSNSQMNPVVPPSYFSRIVQMQSPGLSAGNNEKLSLWKGTLYLRNSSDNQYVVKIPEPSWTFPPQARPKLIGFVSPSTGAEV
jgi:hypothetical protein